LNETEDQFAPAEHRRNNAGEHAEHRPKKSGFQHVPAYDSGLYPVIAPQQFTIAMQQKKRHLHLSRPKGPWANRLPAPYKQGISDA
jgi:hypothetical protein